MMLLSPQHNGGPILLDPSPDDRMQYIQWHIKDYLRGVQKLKPDVIGVYSIILCLIYDHMGQLPDDDRYIAGHCDIEVRYFRKLKACLLAEQKIFEADGYLYNNRALSEIAKFCATAKKKREAAAAREEKKRQEREAAQAQVAATPTPDARASRAHDAPDRSASGARQERVAHVKSHVKHEKSNDFNGRPTTAVLQIEKEKERETEKEKKESHPSSSVPAVSRASGADEDGGSRVTGLAAQAAALAARLHEVGKGALANPAGASALLSLSPILAWLEAGADPELDIIPAVTSVAAKTKARGMQMIRSWDYFNTEVAQARARRMAGLPTHVEKARPRAIDNEAVWEHLRGLK